MLVYGHYVDIDVDTQIILTLNYANRYILMKKDNMIVESNQTILGIYFPNNQTVANTIYF